MRENVVPALNIPLAGFCFYVSVSVSVFGICISASTPSCQLLGSYVVGLFCGTAVLSGQSGQVGELGLQSELGLLFGLIGGRLKPLASNLGYEVPT